MRTSRAASDDDGIVYTPAMLLWALLTGVQRSCRAAVQRVAVQRVAVYYALVGREVSSTNTGAYCLARAKVTAGVASRCGVRRPFPTTGGGTASVRWSWTARCSRCPTPSRTRQSILSPPARPRGLGFPILRAVALTPLATGLVLALATGLCAGKEAGETALPRTLFDQLQRGDLVLADRCYGGWFLLALLRALGVEFVTRLHQHRTADFTRGRRLSQGDHRVAWPRPQKPEWLDQE